MYVCVCVCVMTDFEPSDGVFFLFCFFDREILLHYFSEIIVNFIYIIIISINLLFAYDLPAVLFCTARFGSCISHSLLEIELFGHLTVCKEMTCLIKLLIIHNNT